MSLSKMHCQIIFLFVEGIILDKARSSGHMQKQQISKGKQNSWPSSIHLKTVFSSVNFSSAKPYFQSPVMPLKIRFCNLSGFTSCCNKSITLLQITASYLAKVLLSFLTELYITITQLIGISVDILWIGFNFLLAGSQVKIRLS